MTPRTESKAATKSTPRAWLRTLLLLGVVGGVVLGIALQDMIGTPSGFNFEGMSKAGLMAPIRQHLTVGELEEPQLAAAKGKNDKKAKSKDKDEGKKGKGNKHHKGKDKADKHHKGKGDKHRKGHKHGKGNVVAAAAATSLTFTPAADAQVSEASPTTNYGTLDRLLVDGGADPDVASYLRFDLSGVTSPVQRATLRVWVQSDGGSQNGPEVRSTGTSWSETGLTWSNRPAPTGGVLDDKGALAGSTWVEYNVTSP